MDTLTPEITAPRQVVLRLTQEQVQVLHEYRRSRRKTLTRVMEEALTEYLDARGIQWPTNARRIA